MPEDSGEEDYLKTVTEEDYLKTVEEEDYLKTVEEEDYLKTEWGEGYLKTSQEKGYLKTLEEESMTTKLSLQLPSSPAMSMCRNVRTSRRGGFTSTTHQLMTSSALTSLTS